MAAENSFSNNGGKFDFVNLLSLLMGPDGAGRQAESVYYGIPVGDRFNLLSSIALSGLEGAPAAPAGVDAGMRAFALVLLRRLLLESWDQIKAQVQPLQMQQFKMQLLETIQLMCSASPSSSLESQRDGLCDLVCALAKNLQDDSSSSTPGQPPNQDWPWNEFLSFLFECLHSNNTASPTQAQIEMKKCALSMLSSLPTVVDGNPRLRELVQILHSSLLQSLTSPPNGDVGIKVAACNAIVNFVVHHLSAGQFKGIIKQFNDCSAPLVTLFASLSQQDQDSDQCNEVGEKLIELAEEAPLLLRPSIDLLCSTCVSLLSTGQERAPEIAHTALEIVVSLAESSPGMIKKRVPTYIRPIVIQVLKMMTEIEDDDDWAGRTSPEDDDDDEDAEQTIGESSLDRLANALGGKVIFPILMEQLPQMLLNSSDWKSRHAALMAFSCAGEGCRSQMSGFLDKLVPGILPYLADSVPRVRYAACNALGQMSTDFESEFEQKFHSTVIPSLLQVLTRDTCERVQAHAGAAMVNFFEECPQEILVNYLDEITGAIEQVLQLKLQQLNQSGENANGARMVVEQLIVTLSAVADTSQEYFQKYYDKFMPCLKFIIQNTQTKELHLLRGKCIECVSLIGMAVGKEQFGADANEVMKMLFEAHSGQIQLEDDDPQLQYMITAWARLCRILGPDFEPYLPYVMGPVLKAASYKVEMALMNAEESAEATEDWECLQIDSQHSFGIRTTGLEKKVTACSMLVCYARELKHAFVNYVEETAKILVPLLKFPFHEDIKESAAECMPHLLESAKARGDQFVAQLWQYIMPEFFKAIQAEEDQAIGNDMMDYFAQCIEKVGPSSLMAPTTGDQPLRELMIFIDEKFKGHFSKCAERLREREQNGGEDNLDQDQDDDKGDDDEDEQRGCLTGLSDLLHALFVTYKDAFLSPYFESVLPHIVSLWSEPKLHWTNHQVAICILDDLIEFTGMASAKYQEIYLPALAAGILRQEPPIRQAALYGLGQLAIHLGPQLAQFFDSIITNLLTVIRDPNARSEDNLLATENGISSLGKILRYCPGLSNHNEVLAIWLERLPIWEDEIEVPHVLEYLISLLEQNNPVILGLNSANLPHVVSVIADAFARTLIEDKNELGQRLVNFLRQVHADPTASLCLNQLSPPQQEAVKNVLAPQA